MRRADAGFVFAAVLAAVCVFGGPLHGQTRSGYIVTSDSARLFYRIAGRGPDTLIAIHGGPGVDHESIAADFAPLAQHHVVIFYDQRGAGRSELPLDTTRLFVPRQIADLDEVRRHFRLQHVTLIAHSYGPLLAASYALAHPDAVQRMIFFGPVPPRRGDFWQRFAAGIRTRVDSADNARMADASRRLADSSADVRQACRDFWAVALKPRLAEPALTQPLIRSDLCASDPAGIRYGLTRTGGIVWRSYGDWDLRARLRNLHVPTLILHGEQEAIPMDLVEEWVAALPDAQLVRIPAAAHFAYAEQPAVVWPAVEAFLERAHYPALWWTPVSPVGAPDWEILPQAARPGEVILSKRNELGLLSNFAPTPFTFRGQRYASLEGFWQMMLYPEGEGDPRASFPGVEWKYTRSQVAGMTAFDAKAAGTLAEDNMRRMGIDWVTFEGKRIQYRSAESAEHYALIVAATEAKVRQNPEVRRVLLATGDLVLRPDHIQEPDAPAEWRYFDLLMQLRSRLRPR